MYKTEHGYEASMERLDSEGQQTTPFTLSASTREDLLNMLAFMLCPISAIDPDNSKAAITFNSLACSQEITKGVVNE